MLLALYKTATLHNYTMLLFPTGEEVFFASKNELMHDRKHVKLTRAWPINDPNKRLQWWREDGSIAGECRE